MCRNNSMNCGCGCPAENNVGCNAGPFVGIDAACIPTIPSNLGSAIIPFSSGNTPAIILTDVSGLTDTVALLGFGTAILGIPLTGTSIDLTTSVGTEAFAVARAGSITAIAASFSAPAAIALNGTVTIRAQIYRATADSNVFNPTNAFVDLVPPLPAIAVGTITRGRKVVTPPVQVADDDLLLMVISASATGTAPLNNFITGNASAGITIA